MSPAAGLWDYIATGNHSGIAPDALARVERLNQRILGYSGPAHYVFFRDVILGCPWIENILVLGVYHGRDIAFIEDAAAHYCPQRAIRITGVDTFTNTPQLDWPKDTKAQTWQEAGFGTPPSIESAR